MNCGWYYSELLNYLVYQTLYILCLLLTDAPCTSRDGTAGVCRKVSECPAAQDDIRNRRLPPPVICGFERNVPIVCCPETRGFQLMKRGEFTA
jgi:hypothetical protein